MANLSDAVSVRQAYLCMFEYLRRYNDRGQSDEVCGMLSGLSLLEDGGSADPAVLDDFLASVEAVMQAERAEGYDEATFRLS